MRKHLLTVAVALAVAFALFALPACGGGGSNSDNSGAGGSGSGSGAQPQPVDVPTGIWVIRYLGNAAGEYVEEFNMMEDFYGRQVNLLEFATVTYGQAAWFDLDATGHGTFTNFTQEPVEVTFDGSAITFADGTTIPYTRDGDRLWFEEEPGFFMILEKVSAQELAKVLSGAWDCVPLEKAQVGDLVALGTYETAPGNDRLEPLKWRVIDKQGDRLLLLCEKLIDSFAYNTDPTQSNNPSLTWENSSLRAFLNGDFLTTCFTADEAALIQVTHLTNPASCDLLNTIWGSLEDKGSATYSELHRQSLPDGPETDDKVFLLSLEEVLHYMGGTVLPSDDPSESNYPFSELDVYPEAIAQVTLAVDDNGSGYYDRQTMAGAWMTRTLSLGSHQNMCVVYIAGSGQVFNYFTYASMFIRPAMWVSVG